MPWALTLYIPGGIHVGQYILYPATRIICKTFLTYCMDNTYLFLKLFNFRPYEGIYCFFYTVYGEMATNIKVILY